MSIIPTGGKATGSVYYDRREIREQLQRRLSSEHVMVSGPRRIDKTSLFHYMRTVMASGKKEMVYLDVEGFDSPKNFIDALRQALPDTITSTVKGAVRPFIDFLDSFKEVKIGWEGGGFKRDGGSAALGWRDKAQALIGYYG